MATDVAPIGELDQIDDAQPLKTICPHAGDGFAWNGLDPQPKEAQQHGHDLSRRDSHEQLYAWIRWKDQQRLGPHGKEQKMTANCKLEEHHALQLVGIE